ncbi:MAG: serine/threonine protein kinase [Nocardioides sp.]|nr:serine/threonine protein kinase [Nocardioides sp.]
MVAFPQEGEQFGRYVIERTLGQGGMGVVYEAKDKALRRKVALKIVLPSLVVDQDFITRFEREANTLAKLRSRNIVQIIEYGEVEGTVYLVTEYVPDGDLHGWLREKGPLETVQALKLVSELSDALADAHRAGVIHRDIKPSNVMLWERTPGELVPYLIDFGIATEGDSNMTRAGSVVGSLPYMSPERHMGEPATAAGDIYSAGCLLWACLTGKAPYSGTDFQLMSAHINDPIPRLPASTPGADIVNPIIQKALAKDVANRYQDASELSKDLQRAGLRLEEGGLGGTAAAAGAVAPDLGSRPGADPRLAPQTGSTSGFANARDAEVQPTIIKRPGESTPAPAAAAATAKEGDETVLTGGSAPRSRPGADSPTAAPPGALPPHHAPGSSKSGRPKWLWPAVGAAAAVLVIVVAGLATSWFGLGGLHGDDAAAADAIAGGVPTPGWATKDEMSCAAQSLVKKESADTLRQHGVVKKGGSGWDYTGTWPADDASAFARGLLDCDGDQWATDIGDDWNVGDTRCMSDNVDEDAMAGLLAVNVLQPDDPRGAATEKAKAVAALDKCYASTEAVDPKVSATPGYLSVDLTFDQPRTPGGKTTLEVQNAGAWTPVKDNAYSLKVADGGAKGCTNVRATVTYAWGTTKSGTGPACGQAQPKKLVWVPEDSCKAAQLAKTGCNSWLLNYEGFAPGKAFTVKLTKNNKACDPHAKCVYKQTPNTTGKGSVVLWSAPKNWHDKFVATTEGLTAVLPNS